MSMGNNKRSRWFTVADAFIIIITIALIAGAAVLFVMPNIDEGEFEKTTLSLQINFDEEYEKNVAALSGNEELFCGAEEIGEIKRKSDDHRTVYASITANYKDGVYYVNDTPLRINGEFSVETKYDLLTGRIASIKKEG